LLIDCPPGTHEDPETLIVRALEERRADGANRVALPEARDSSRGSATG
jgi:hypothetical protein